MANGLDPEGIRKCYYPDWTNEDFQRLLHELGEEA